MYKITLQFLCIITTITNNTIIIIKINDNYNSLKKFVT